MAEAYYRAEPTAASSWPHRVSWLIATGFGSGLATVVPATVGSAVALLIYALHTLWLAPFLPQVVVWGLVALAFFGGSQVSGKFATPGDPDPRYVVWDEFVGMWVACLLTPGGWLALLAAFVFFRLFDILKPFPIRRLERLPGGMGIMADDLLAGIYAGTAVQALFWCFQ